MMSHLNYLLILVACHLVLVIAPLDLFCQTDFVGENPKLAAWQVGKKKEVVIVLHGGPCAEHTYLRPEFDRLKKWAKVIYYDQRGCGKSDQAHLYVWQEHVEDLRRVIQHFAPDRKVFLAGSSWGSALALLYAYQHPKDLKGLILSGLFKWEGRGEDISQYLRVKNRTSFQPHHIDTRMHLLKEHQIQLDKKENTGDAQIVIEIEKVAYINSGPPQNQTRRSLRFAPVFGDLTEIKTPLIIFNGTRACGWVAEVKKYREIFPEASYVEIDEACHDPWFANPEVFFDECHQFIKKNKRERRKKIANEKS